MAEPYVGMTRAPAPPGGYSPIKRRNNPKSSWDNRETWISKLRTRNTQIMAGDADKEYILDSDDRRDLHYEKGHSTNPLHTPRLYFKFEIEYRAWEVHGGPAGLAEAIRIRDLKRGAGQAPARDRPPHLNRGVNRGNGRGQGPRQDRRQASALPQLRAASPPASASSDECPGHDSAADDNLPPHPPQFGPIAAGGGSPRFPPVRDVCDSNVMPPSRKQTKHNNAAAGPSTPRSHPRATGSGYETAAVKRSLGPSWPSAAADLELSSPVLSQKSVIKTPLGSSMKSFSATTTSSSSQKLKPPADFTIDIDGSDNEESKAPVGIKAQAHSKRTMNWETGSSASPAKKQKHRPKDSEVIDLTCD